MRRLVRTPFVVKSFMRGGHGWERPDPPLYEPYIDRRHYNWLDSGFTMLDACQPEYSISNNEVFLEDPVLGPKYVLALLAFVGGLYTMMLVSNKIFLHYRKVQPRNWSVVESDSSSAHKIAANKLPQKYIANNPFGLNLTFEQAVMEKSVGYMTPKYLDEMAVYKNLALEGHKFIERKIAEATKQVEEGSGSQAHH